MSEQKPEKKVVSRTVAIALGIICIVLAVVLIGAIMNYTAIISGKDNSITSITSQNNQLQTWLNGNKTDRNIVNLVDSVVWLNQTSPIQVLAGSTTWEESGCCGPRTIAPYAGYLNCTLISPYAYNISFRVYYTSYGVNYDHTIRALPGQTVSFPVLPGQIGFLVQRSSNVSTTETVTIIYYY
jgi:hypothetical protein